MHWFATGLLIALTAGVAGWTGWLLRRLFVVEPAPVVDAATGPQGTDDENAEEPTA